MGAHRVVITGMGVVSPFGVGLETYWQHLLAGDSGIRPIEGFAAGVYRSPLGAEVPRDFFTDETRRAAMGSPAEDSAYYLAVAAEEALRDAKVDPVFSDEDRVACVLGTLCAGSRNLMTFGKAYLDGAPPPDHHLADATLVNYQLRYLVQRHNLTGPSSLVSTACASTTDAIGYAFDLIQQGECERALVGGSDILSEVIHGGFNALFAITDQRPRPFDRSRNGFCIGEGAGVMYLESLDSATRRGAQGYAEVLGYGLSNTAHHLTATSEDGHGEALAVTRALAEAGISAGHIDYINTHGTATTHNDATEMKAIARVFGGVSPAILANSNKPAIGHCMGAAGIMEAVSTIMSIRTGRIPPTLFTHADEDELGIDLVHGVARQARIGHALSESFGFGGACSCVVFAQPHQGATHV